jgi:hypothetical protein
MSHSSSWWGPDRRDAAERLFGRLPNHEQAFAVKIASNRCLPPRLRSVRWIRNTCSAARGSALRPGEGSGVSDETLTDRQREILEFIVTEQRQRGYPPSVREIGEAVGLTSPSTVHTHLATLQKRGCSAATPPSRAPSRCATTRRRG